MDQSKTKPKDIERPDLEQIITHLKEILKLAEQKHPNFAFGPYHALSYIAEEFGELSKEITKRSPGWHERAKAEAFDLLVVVVRFIREDHLIDSDFD